MEFPFTGSKARMTGEILIMSSGKGVGKTMKSILNAALWKIKRKVAVAPPSRGSDGLCNKVESLVGGASYELFLQIAREWPERAEHHNHEYLVAHPTMAPDRAYWVTDFLWQGEYGGNRMRLLNWCIQQTGSN